MSKLQKIVLNRNGWVVCHRAQVLLNFNNGMGATAIGVGKSEGFHIHPIVESDMNFSAHPGNIIQPFGIYPFS